jgi:hypothetical protein
MLPATTSSFSGDGPTIEGHAEQMRSTFSDAMGEDSNAERAEGEFVAVTSESKNAGSADTAGQKGKGSSKTSPPTRRGPSVHRYNIGTWGAYHAARIATRGIANLAHRATEKKE